MLRGSPLGGEWSCVAGLIRWCWVSKMCTMHAPDCQVMANTAGLLRAKSAMHETGWLERTMEEADAAPCFLERLSEAMLQSFCDRFGGLSKLTTGWTGVYMGGGRMRTRTAMLEISWLPRSLQGLMLRFGLLTCACLFFLGCLLLVAMPLLLGASSY